MWKEARSEWEEETEVGKKRTFSKVLKQKKRTVLVIAVVTVGLSAAGIYVLQEARGKKADAREMPVQEAQAETGSIANTVVGTGNLEYEEGVSITIPSGIAVDVVNVEANERVSKGDVLAEVNQASVLRAMEDVQEEIEALDEEIEESQEETDSQSITSKVNGTVKKIYVKQGQGVSDCMVKKGALLILSMEDSVDTEEESGAELAITATAGTVEEICVSEGEEVSGGTTLLKIEDSGQSLKYQELMAERQELADSLKELMALSQSGVITADSDGIIKSVNISSCSTEGAGNTQDAQTAAAENGIVQASVNMGMAQISKKAAAVVGTAQDSSDEEEQELTLALKIMDSGISGRDTLVLEPPQTGSKPQTSLCAQDGSYEGTVSWKPECQAFAAETSYQSYVELTAAEGYLFSSGSISLVKTGVLSGVSVTEEGKKLSFSITYPFTAAEKPGGGNGNDNENSGNGGNGNENENKNENEGDGNGGIGGDDGNRNGNDEENNGGNKDGNEEADGKKDETGEKGSEGNGGSGEPAANNGVSVAGTASVGSRTGTVSVSGNQSVSLSASGTSGSGSSSQDSGTEADSGTRVAAFTMASSDMMILSVNVDELDINSMAEGQQAEVILDALEGETFTGTVSKVGNMASSSGSGVAKYTVDVEIPGDERMKQGMNASATITIEKQENVVTIPVNALQERGNQVFVYTQSDSEGNLSGEQEVVTGLSDGNNVEITEGLSEGDIVYFRKTGNISGQEHSQKFGGMEGGPGGNMGDMPQNGFKGGESGRGMPDGGMPGGSPQN